MHTAPNEASPVDPNADVVALTATDAVERAWRAAAEAAGNAMRSWSQARLSPNEPGRIRADAKGSPAHERAY